MTRKGKILLSELEKYGYHTFGYHYLKTQNEFPVHIDSFGYEYVDSAGYFFDSKNRAGEEGNCIFQYTTGGSGILEYEGKTYHLKEGEAFLVPVPGDSRYYLPFTSSSWEFLFITFKGVYARNVWQKIFDARGPVILCNRTNPVITYLLSYYKESCSALDSSSSVSGKPFASAFDNSAVGYQFLMILQKMLFAIPAQDESLSGTISFFDKALLYMNDHLSEQISLEDIAAHVHLTKYYFNRIFHEKTGISPWNYLTKLRIENAARMLISTDKTVTEIAHMCGYPDENYFHKVFKKYVGASAVTFRKSYSGNVHFSLEIL